MICDRIKECCQEQFDDGKAVTCANRPENCIISSDRRTRVKCEENKKKYVLVNSRRNQIISYKIDGGALVTDCNVPEGTRKCDYMFVINGEERTAIITELKGVNVRDSLKQLANTLTLFESFFQSLPRVYARAVVAASIPDIKAEPSYVNLRRKLQRYNGNVKILKSQWEELDTELNTL